MYRGSSTRGSFSGRGSRGVSRGGFRGNNYRIRQTIPVVSSAPNSVPVATDNGAGTLNPDGVSPIGGSARGGGLAGRGSSRGGHNGVFYGSANFHCNNCIAQQNLVCDHCFLCGSSGHQSYQCPLN